MLDQQYESGRNYGWFILRAYLGLNLYKSIFTFDGRFSTIRTEANGTIPADAVNITNDRLITGTHWKFDSAYPFWWRYEYKAKLNNPQAEPKNEIYSNILRPNVSLSWPVHKFPTICMTAIAIDE